MDEHLHSIRFEKKDHRTMLTLAKVRLNLVLPLRKYLARFKGQDHSSLSADDGDGVALLVEAEATLRAQVMLERDR